MKTVICFGDSNTYGYDPRSYLGGRYGPDSRWVDLLAARTGWDVRNQGQNGRTIPGGPVPFPAAAARRRRRSGWNGSSPPWTWSGGGSC